MKHLRPATPDDLRALTAVRPGEARVGERAATLDADGRAPAGARVALLGVPEDIGVRANGGRPGTRRMWKAFLPRVLNMQSNAFLDGGAVVVAGRVDVRDLRDAADAIDEARGGAVARAEALQRLRGLVAEVDARVASVVAALRAQGLVPIVVGGGHNNAYGILAGCARAAGGAVNCVNVDLHADLRPAEGRHSGNAFTYAKAEGLLARYAVAGMSERYATQAIVDAIEADESIAAFTFESILRGRCDLAHLAESALQHVGPGPATLELDLDAVAGAPASATAASGFTPAEFRSLAIRLADGLDLHAVHLAEGAPGLAGWPPEVLAKLAAEIALDMACAAVRAR
jgi:formiminoglutamase